ncbi:hypothetical protein [Acidibrevibacterium fodinaquatile]|jgi:transposase-like protein|uniref:hypothetical protein n=1 Tax=Acidibrevibacterium fodinaquatile TaxID=1969806 RepID=UPI0019650883
MVPEVLHYLGRAVDQDGVVLDILVQSRRVQGLARGDVRPKRGTMMYPASVVSQNMTELG